MRLIELLQSMALVMVWEVTLRLSKKEVIDVCPVLCASVTRAYSQHIQGRPPL